ncbi:hypothetical protein Bca52824_017086 [Brassica carinata]|uniref:Pentatricopeptide repeat-containing protein n=1 Tax=Brassica carinata TaxID=52824 RepID=A0A8X7VLZ8_BRACI|nr:hypothetical protein Bca52824_017086 [Brassica carinata]
MSAVKNISSFRLTSLLRRENDPSAAIRLFRNPDPESTNPQKPFRDSLHCYDLIITKLGGSKMFDELDQILLQLKSDTRIVPTEILFCNVISYFCLPARALHVFDEMSQYRCQLPTHCQSGCFDEAFKLFDEIVKRKVKPTGVTFGTLIHGLCKDLKVKEALKMKHDMLKVFGVFPTVHVYASLIKALCRVGELSLAFKLNGEVKVDSAIYSTLINSLVKAGRGKGCEPDAVTDNVLINGFSVENDFESTYRVLDEMVGKGSKPDVISYNVMLGALYLFEDMPRRGCVPDILSYRIVFDGLCEALQFEEAAVILDEMMFKGYKPRRDRLERFLQRLCESGKLEILGNANDADFWSVIVLTVCKEPVMSVSIDLLLNALKKEGP